MALPADADGGLVNDYVVGVVYDAPGEVMADVAAEPESDEA